MHQLQAIACGGIKLSFKKTRVLCEQLNVIIHQACTNGTEPATKVLLQLVKNTGMQTSLIGLPSPSSSSSEN